MFARVCEKEVTAAIAENFYNMLKTHTENDVIVVGAGPSGLMAAMELAKAGRKVLLVEQNNYLGGGFWIGGYLMNKITVRSPAEKILADLAIKYKEHKPGLYVTDGPYACSKLIYSACEAGAAVLNMTKFDDVVLRNGSVAGVVVNWSPVAALPRQISCVDPIALEAKITIDATGHEAAVATKLAEKGLMKIAGEGSMSLGESEDAVIEHTGEAFKGLIVAGMAVATVYGLPRMGPTFGAMLLSGKKAAETALSLLR